MATTFSPWAFLLIAQDTNSLGKGFQAISDGNGLAIALTGMLIVFFALAIITLFIRLLPVVLVWLEPILPRLESHADSPSVAEQLPTEREKIVAAIGYVLHREMEKAAQGTK